MPSTPSRPTESTTESVSNADFEATLGRSAHQSDEPDSNPPSQEFPVSLRQRQQPDRDWEFTESETVPPGVKGKLKPRLSFWKNDLKASAFVIDTIEYGYKIPFEHEPPPFFVKNNRSSLNHAPFVETAIDELLRKQCIIEVDSQPYCCNPLTVSEGKKLRLVLDLRHPNQFVKKFKFKYEDLPHIAQVLEAGQYYFSFDFESGYHHVEIFSPHQQYLGFSWNHQDTVTRYYVFTVLPFGLNSACYLFYKVDQALSILLARKRFNFFYLHR